MPADFSQYVDLTVYDKEPGDMYLEAIEMARLTLPEFNLRVGTVEDAIFQAISWIGWVNATAINRIPDRLMAGILSMMGVTINLSSPAQMGVTVTADSYEGATVPIGTLFGYTSIFEDELIEYVFMAVESVEISAVESPEPGDPFPSAVIQTECLTSGVIPSINVGTPLTILSPSTLIISAEAYSDFQNGVNEETSSSFLSRAVSYLASLSSTLVTGSQVDAFVSNTYPALVGRVRTYDLTNGESGVGDISTEKTYTDILTAVRNSNISTITFGPNVSHQFSVGDTVYVDISSSTFNGAFEITAKTSSSISYANTGTNTSVSTPTGTVSRGYQDVGNITVFVYGNNAFLSPSQLSEIETAITDKCVPGLFVFAKNMELLELDVTAEIVLDSNYDQEPLKQTIENTLIEYLSPAYFPLSEDVLRANQIIATISSIPGVRYVSSLSLSPAGGNWLPQVDANLEPANKGWSPRITPDNLTISYLAV